MRVNWRKRRIVIEANLVQYFRELSKAFEGLVWFSGHERRTWEIFDAVFTVGDWPITQLARGSPSLMGNSLARLIVNLIVIIKKRPERRLNIGSLADRVRFELTIRLNVYRISSPAHSTTLPPVRVAVTSQQDCYSSNNSNTLHKPLAVSARAFI